MTATTSIRPTVVHDTTLGPVILSASPHGLTRVRFGRPADGARAPAPSAGSPEQHLLGRAVAELDEYLLGRRADFEVPVDLSGVGPPHRAVLDSLRHVGYGRTAAYAELARAAGLTADGPRRAGAACARNPVLVVVPCHRIVAPTARSPATPAGCRSRGRSSRSNADSSPSTPPSWPGDRPTATSAGRRHAVRRCAGPRAAGRIGPSPTRPRAGCVHPARAQPARPEPVPAGAREQSCRTRSGLRPNG